MTCTTGQHQVKDHAALRQAHQRAVAAEARLADWLQHESVLEAGQTMVKEQVEH
jgi:hypothetical protein